MATVLAISLLVSLGRWQLNRADEKQMILAQLAQNMAQEAVQLPSPDEMENVDNWRYRKVYFSGIPMQTRQFLLDNQVRNRRAGFNVLTVFRMTDGRHLLVDRGWMPIGLSRDELPDVSIPAEMTRIEGYIYAPYGEPFKAGGYIEEVAWPRIIAYLDFVAISRQSEVSLPKFVVRMSKDITGGYQRDWPLTALSPDKHFGYAFQWFALAVAVLVIFFLLNIKRRK